jgi:hypothetical protein
MHKSCCAGASLACTTSVRGFCGVLTILTLIENGKMPDRVEKDTCWQLEISLRKDTKCVTDTGYFFKI